MITVDEVSKSVTITESEGDIVRIDGGEFQLVDGAISIVNLPSVYDVEVFKKVEENHIPKTEPDPVEELPFEEPIIEEEVFEEEIVEEPIIEEPEI